MYLIIQEYKFYSIKSRNTHSFYDNSDLSYKQKSFAELVHVANPY